VVDPAVEESATATPSRDFFPLFLSRNERKRDYIASNRPRKPFSHHDHHPFTDFLDPLLIYGYQKPSTFTRATFDVGWFSSLTVERSPDSFAESISV
jgi:hypothetical protein